MDAWDAYPERSSSDQKKDGHSKCMILCRDCGCWMCDPEQYENLSPNCDRKIERLVDQDNRTYVIVPQESHVRHHLLIVLKAQKGKHKRGLMECKNSDLLHLSKTLFKWCSILKEQFRYDTVYAGCYSDEGHVHFHLIPFRYKHDKGYSGFAMAWLAEKEGKSAASPFGKMSQHGKFKRLLEIRKIVKELLKAKLAQCQSAIDTL